MLAHFDSAPGQAMITLGSEMFPSTLPRAGQSFLIIGATITHNVLSNRTWEFFEENDVAVCEGTDTAMYIGYVAWLARACSTRLTTRCLQ